MSWGIWSAWRQLFPNALIDKLVILLCFDLYTGCLLLRVAPLFVKFIGISQRCCLYSNADILSRASKCLEYVK
jgi:hypothetical protein